MPKHQCNFYFVVPGHQIFLKTKTYLSDKVTHYFFLLRWDIET